MALSSHFIGDNDMGAEPPAPRPRPALPLPLIAKILSMLAPADDALASEYVGDIVKSMLSQEKQQQVLTLSPLDHSGEVHREARATCVHWLLTWWTGLRKETLYLAVHLLDRFLARRPSDRQRLKLAALAALRVAGKFEEEESLHLAPTPDVTVRTLTDMERLILTTLDYNIAVPTAAHFLPVFLDVMWTWRSVGSSPLSGNGPTLREFTLLRRVKTKADELRERTAWALVDLALVYQSSACCAPSLLAASAVLLSNQLFGCQPDWPITMAQLSSYPRHKLDACVLQLKEIYAHVKRTSSRAVACKSSVLLRPCLEASI
mmetsp:Transcript_1664/g.5160  ORF Transcript_1664/g.5160 Transcript_1664/m.5160 type:complete len:319 (+) Transcript_1664:65-1021(+)